ncbi:tRNA (adenosine(37)-N6)-threonylcarbamoyltransferase complex dimerization subunit type 1 TsaB [Buchnera aphidicola]|uniref:tRNA threonylcarbamoyladenosine biosynthesis protein TsaB n=1 Tax=Buchnera aphidicola subsp. Acyrthosiphon pisum (strain 5A) TaxID=563178 RepID=A0A7U4DIG0_BUCA5|nr:tRNA (adenosine(37)-N6)-threonylcarbamoyltransferase complex dimerization subunit type 1 TsaB [Buchnera aphidicola]ACL30685.1 hypothetical protein BUAP5A_317 [Buchnera aphidicola str. 5A (Acyrthosiphon pisum)]
MSNIILSIESSLDCCSVAIYKNEYIHSLSEKCKKKHTTHILPMIKEILSQTKTEFKELNYVSFSKGPGNFTSIRIAASIAQSLSISLKIPIISVSTLAIMAEKTFRKYKQKDVIVAMHAKKKQVYWAKYTRNKNSIWIGEYTESLLEKKIIQEKIENLKKRWTLVSDQSELIEFQNILNVKKIYVFLPNAKDIIPFVLLKIKNKNKSFSIENNINYLYNQF